jgi:hypothetical protein
MPRDDRSTESTKYAHLAPPDRVDKKPVTSDKRHVTKEELKNSKAEMRRSYLL